MAEIEKDGIYEKTGRWVTEDFPAAKLMGLSKRRKEIFDQVQTDVYKRQGSCQY